MDEEALAEESQDNCTSMPLTREHEVEEKRERQREGGGGGGEHWGPPFAKVQKKGSRSQTERKRTEENR